MVALQSSVRKRRRDGPETGLARLGAKPTGPRGIPPCYNRPVDELEAELAAIAPEHREEIERRLALRQKARQIAVRIGADEGDVFHVLRNMQLSPTERLRRGLIHGRRRPRISE